VALLSVDRLEQRAKNIVLHQLSKGAKTSMQLREILQQREIPEQIAEAVIQRFTEVELVDDKQYAQGISDSRRRTKGMSKSAISRELSQKGLDAETIQSVTEDITPEQELETATELAVKKHGQMLSLSKEVRTRRIAGFLSRRGYPSSIVFAAIREAEEQAVKSDF
jgi:regulatory protein